MVHEECEDCDYSIYNGHHEVGVITLCSGEGIRFICNQCEIEEFWEAPPHGLERAKFGGMIEDMVNSHITETLFFGTDEEDGEPSSNAIIKIPFWQRVMIAARVLKTKYVMEIDN